MAEICPFRGLRYHPGQVGDLARVIAPPYDAISPAEQQALHDRSPHNVVRLEYGEAHPDDSEHNNRYTRAAATLAQWLDSGVLLQDDGPAFYVYDQEFEHAAARYRRRALLTRVGLEDWAKGAVRPHERTMPRPKEDRLRLLRACRANTSPIFALYREGLSGNVLIIGFSSLVLAVATILSSATTIDYPFLGPATAFYLLLGLLVAAGSTAIAIAASASVPRARKRVRRVGILSLVASLAFAGGLHGGLEKVLKPHH